MGVCFPMDRCREGNGGCEQTCNSQNGEALCSCRRAPPSTTRATRPSNLLSNTDQLLLRIPAADNMLSVTAGALTMFCQGLSLQGERPN